MNLKIYFCAIHLLSGTLKILKNIFDNKIFTILIFVNYNRDFNFYKKAKRVPHLLKSHRSSYEPKQSPPKLNFIPRFVTDSLHCSSLCGIYFH